MRIYTFVGVDIPSTVEVEVVWLQLVRLDNSEQAEKFAKEVSEFGVRNVMMHAATSDEVLATLRANGLVPFSYDMSEKTFTEIV